MLKRVYVWEFPVRLSHWLNFLAITALTITGYYIGAPFINAIREKQLIMAKFRFVHFVAAYVFAWCVLVRIYWWFVGNKYARWDQFLPFSSERLKSCVDTTAFYCFIREKLPDYAGHTGMAGLTYFFMFMLFLIEMLTGSALYSFQFSFRSPPGRRGPQKARQKGASRIALRTRSRRFARVDRPLRDRDNAKVKPVASA